MSEDTKKEVKIGWVTQPLFAADSKASAELVERAAGRLREHLDDQFPDYRWECEFSHLRLTKCLARNHRSDPQH